MAPEAANARFPLRHRLALRFGLVLCLGVAAIFVALSVWNVRTQREHMIRLATRASDRVSALIRSATRDAMLRNDLAQMERILATIGADPDIERIRILDRKGKVHSSTKHVDKGQVVEATAFQCRACHVREPPIERPNDDQRVQIVEGPDGRLVLDVIAPIYNEPACYTSECHSPHPPDQKVLGVIDVQLPMGPVEDLISTSERQLGIGLLITLAAIVGLVAWLTWRMVLRPVGNLSRASARVATGDLSVRVPMASDDELGRMTSTWNAMVAELDKTRGELEAWSHTLEERVEEKTRELEAAHRRMLVVEKMASLGKLAAVVAHEINNPLAGIATYAKLMRRRLSDKAAGDGDSTQELAALELMETEANRCGRIVRNLLLFSRTPGARFDQTDLGAVVTRCALLVKHQAELQEVTLTTDIDPELPMVECDASQIQQVVLALMMNALDAMPEGGTLTIGVYSVLPGDSVRIEVEDTGCGIKSEDLPRIFEPFFTTKEQGEGVGLGLAVVYGIVQRHRGQVDVRSAPGTGTRFFVHLPVEQPEPDSAEAPAHRGEVS